MENTLNQIDIYCLNFTTNPYEKNERRIEMENKFTHFNLPVFFYSGVIQTDERIAFVKNDHLRRTWSMCYGHLDMINHFANNSEKEYAIICEDDIIIHKDFTKKLPDILNVIKEYHFDLLLLGYLCSNPVDTYSNFPQIATKYSNDTFKILKYNKETWGTQMYMLSKKQAKLLLSKYYDDYAKRTLTDNSLTPFSSDWLITKEGNTALVYPLLVIENGNFQYEDEGQRNSRINCYNFSFRENTFI